MWYQNIYYFKLFEGVFRTVYYAKLIVSIIKRIPKGNNFLSK